MCTWRRSVCSTATEKLPSHARVVICGGGVQGAAVSYYLAQLGWGKDTIVLDQGRLGGGSAFHTAGLIGAFKPTVVETKITEESIRLYDELTDAGYETGWKQCGSLLLARTRDRLTHFRRMRAHSVCRQIECHIVSADEIADKYPYVHTADLQGGLWIPKDGVADPSLVCHSLADIASRSGVKMFEHIQVSLLKIDLQALHNRLTMQLIVAEHR